MKVVIFDIDDTIVDETKFMKNNAPQFIMEEYGITVTEINPNGYDVKEVYDLKNYFLNHGFSEDEAIEKSNEINKKFWNKNFVKYCMQPIKDGVKDTINYFKEHGYKIHFVSLRGKPTAGKVGSISGDFIRLGVVPLLTKIQLVKGGLKFDVLKLVKSNEEKINYINSMSPDFVFEDQSSIISEINPNSKVFCVDTLHNKFSSLSDDVTRISNVSLAEIKNCVSEVMENNNTSKKNTLMNNAVANMCITNPIYLRKILTETTYTIVKTIGSPIFNSKYKPIIKGADNIPKDGAVAFVGNHRDKLDPVLITATQNRKVHWGALLRMFQGKENLFSSGKNSIPCYLSAAFITAMGAVPIARKDDENYLNINLKSIQMMNQMLSWNGAVGLFPEGTLNRNPNEQNILHLKSNRVFRLVKDNEGIIQPFSIVWLPKDLDIENRVIVNYGTPINTRNKSAKEISTMWNEIVDEDIELSKRLIEEIKDVSDVASNKEKNKKIKYLIKQFKNK